MKLDRGEVPTRLAPNSHMTRITSHIAPPNTCLQKAWRRFYSSEVRNHLRLFSGKVLDTYSVVEMQCNKQFCKNVITLDMTQFYLCYNFFSICKLLARIFCWIVDFFNICFVSTFKISWSYYWLFIWFLQ